MIEPAVACKVRELLEQMELHDDFHGSVAIHVHAGEARKVEVRYIMQCEPGVAPTETTG